MDTKQIHYFDNTGNMFTYTISDTIDGKLPYQPHRVYAKWNDEFICNRTVGDKTYEIKDHLGNVRVLVSDLKTTADTVDVKGYNDYYPFGALMPGRQYNANQYRYLFNGMEQDQEIAGIGNSYTAEFWQYDPRIGRRWNVDPIKYAWQSSYATFNNNPVYFVDPWGLQGGEPEKKKSHIFKLSEEGVITDEIRYITVKPKSPSFWSKAGKFLAGVGSKIIGAISGIDIAFTGTPESYEKGGGIVLTKKGSAGGQETRTPEPGAKINYVETEWLIPAISGLSAGKFQFGQGPFAVAQGVSATIPLAREVAPTGNAEITTSSEKDVKNETQKTSSEVHNNIDLTNAIKVEHLSGYDEYSGMVFRYTFKGGETKIIKETV